MPRLTTSRKLFTKDVLRGVWLSITLLVTYEIWIVKKKGFQYGKTDRLCPHLLWGWKRKTTCGMGLCTRAAGYGYRVLIYQFMKDNSTSERKVLLLSPNVTFVPGQDKIKFSFLMTPEEKAEQKRYYEEQFQRVTEKAVQEEYDVLFLDELVYTIGSKLLYEQLLLDFLDHKPEKLEVILTGQGPSEALIERADYVSELKKIKHPFDKGLAARDGIER